MTYRGATGEIRWAYLAAAVFGPWRLEFENEHGELTGTIVSVDGYRVTQAPLHAVLTVGRQRLTYPIISLQVNGSTLSAQVGPRLEQRS
jgi:hypothetical protein